MQSKPAFVIVPPVLLPHTDMTALMFFPADFMSLHRENCVKLVYNFL